MLLNIKLCKIDLSRPMHHGAQLGHPYIFVLIYVRS